jgi:transcriptional regulator with XRE-family HTH domain/16S rRNA G966 N2-methylase RsmD
MMRNQSGRNRKRCSNYSEFAERLRRIIKIRGVSYKSLEVAAQITDRSRRAYMAGRSYPNPGTMARLASALGVTAAQLENPEAFSELMYRLAVAFDELTFEQMFEVLQDLDTELLKWIRSTRLNDQEIITRGYNDLLRGTLTDKGIDLPGFLNRIHDRNFIKRLLNSLPTKPRLEVVVGNNFDRIDFFHDGSLLLPMAEPKLLWDCCCQSGPDPSPSCRIHSHPMGNKVKELFNTGLVEIKWRGMTFLWRQCDVLWPPSVDSFFLMECLQNSGATQAEVQSVLDIGSGTGFLGIALAKLNPNIKRVVLSDWLLTPALFGQLNSRINDLHKRGVAVNSQVAIYTQPSKPNEGPFDLVVCNPPYLPCLAGFEQAGIESTVFGTDLLEHVIQMAKMLGKQVYIQYSHLAHIEAERAARSAGATLKVIGTKPDVPFRVSHAIARPKYIERLVHERKLKRSRKTGHRYFHDLLVCRVV